MQAAAAVATAAAAGATAASASIGPDPLETWLWRVEQALTRAPTRMAGPVHLDTDVCESRSLARGAPRPRLVGVRAAVELSLHLPPLPRGLRLGVRDGGLWIEGPADTPPETLGAALEEVLDDKTLRLIALPEIAAGGDAFLDDPDWIAMELTFTLGPIAVCVEGPGVRVTVTIVVEGQA